MVPGGISPSEITLGLLAGGQGTRLGGADKAWLIRDGEPQVLRLVRLFSAVTGCVLVSANRAPERLVDAGLRAVPDRVQGLGPIGGLDALAAACTTDWLLTLPVDVLEAGPSLLDMLAAGRGKDGACARDDDGPQPLLALWRLPALRPALQAALASGELAVHALQGRLRMRECRFHGIRFGNLNTPADLVRAGIDGAA